jgi:hypothetical protein
MIVPSEGKILFAAEPNLKCNNHFVYLLRVLNPTARPGGPPESPPDKISKILVHRRKMQKASSYLVHVLLSPDQFYAHS